MFPRELFSHTSTEIYLFNSRENKKNIAHIYVSPNLVDKIKSTNFCPQKPLIRQYK